MTIYFEVQYFRGCEVVRGNCDSCMILFDVSVESLLVRWETNPQAREQSMEAFLLSSFFFLLLPSSSSWTHVFNAGEARIHERLSESPSQ